MEWRSINELRELYLAFFESKGHLRLPSASLVPHGDKSILLINAGMTPLKKYFTGEVTPPCVRCTSCQKCVRVLDIDRVGSTARHLTYFEMLGNFSFGDYFKYDAIPWAWEFLTKTLNIDPDLLYPSVFTDDDEAAKIWTDIVGVPAERVVRLGREDNFWEHGSGPCGPCSEIYFDRGEQYGCGKPDCAPGCDCDRYIEIWNNVFTQFNSDGKGTYTELASKNIDTGMGLERLACVIQGVDSVFGIDTFKDLLGEICAISGKEYGKTHKTDVSLRVVSDHIRSATMLICDGVLPSNEGRGYVLRRIIRRAARHGKLLGITKPFLWELCDMVVEQNRTAYPELDQKHDYIKKVMRIEEERFDATVDAGLSILDEIISKIPADGTIPGAEAFKLYDTFGFPVDLTREIAAERGLTVDEDGFTVLMNEQRERARGARNGAGGWSEAAKSAISDLPATEFVGYNNDTTTAKVLALFSGDMSVETVSEGEFTMILDRTVFYGEGGGQVGDRGEITSAGGFSATVSDTKKKDGVYIHECVTSDGAVSVGDTVLATIDVSRRSSIRRNHTSAHLLQAALRKVLGSHVEQAGSYVDDERMRFDFSHFTAVTADELEQVENIVNNVVLSALPVETSEMTIEKAQKMGAMALFGEKYGNIVRVVDVKGFSTELCGGTHVDNTAKLGLFKIISESSVAAGVRRIEAVTGFNVLGLIASQKHLISESCELLKVKDHSELPLRISHFLDESHLLQSEMTKMRGAMASMRAKALYSDAKDIKGISLISARLDGENSAMLRELSEKLINDRPADTGVVVVLAAVDNGKGNFAVSCSKESISRGLKAGDIAREAAKLTGGNGGGRPDFAMAGAKDNALIDKALSNAAEIISASIKDQE